MVNKQKFKGITLYRKRCVDNIIKIYNDSISENEEGWYTEANKLATELASKNGLSNLQVAGIIAALSPLKSWNENKRIAEQFIRIGSTLHTRAMVSKAKDIRDYNESMQREFILTTLNGNKISSFFINIAFPEDPNYVTIDRHAISIALGRSIKNNEGNITNKQYEFLTSCYKQVGESLGVVPNKVQAVTWVKWRQLKLANKFAEVPF